MVQQINKTICMDADVDKLEYSIFPVGDVHYGSREFDEKRLLEYFKFIWDTENSGIILNGDLIDNAICGSPSNVNLQQYSADEQYDKIYELFYPLKDKIIAITTGNHEDRSMRAVGVNLTERLAKDFFGRDSFRNYYADTVYNIALKFSVKKGNDIHNQIYTIAGRHGSSGGSTLGGKANGMTRIKNLVTNADIYITGHSHTAMSATETCNYVDANGQIQSKDIYYINNGAFLKNDGSYGERHAYQPSSYSQTYAMVNPMIRKIRTITVNP